MCRVKPVSELCMTTTTITTTTTSHSYFIFLNIYTQICIYYSADKQLAISSTGYADVLHVDTMGAAFVVTGSSSASLNILQLKYQTFLLSLRNYYSVLY